jgi:hypothetical protein
MLKPFSSTSFYMLYQAIYVKAKVKSSSVCNGKGTCNMAVRLHLSTSYTSILHSFTWHWKRGQFPQCLSLYKQELGNILYMSVARQLQHISSPAINVNTDPRYKFTQALEVPHNNWQDRREVNRSIHMQHATCHTQTTSTWCFSTYGRVQVCLGDTHIIIFPIWRDN